MRTRIPLIVAVAALAACGDDDPVADSLPSVPAASTAPAPTSPEPALEGREFIASGVEGHELVEDSQVRLSFDGDTIGASGGCNSLASTWSLAGDRLVVADMAMTEMACEPAARMEQDTWLASFLTGGPSVTLDGDALTLTGADAVITLVDREVAEPDRELEGTTWVLDSIVSGDAVSSVPTGTPVPTLNFAAGQLAVDTGCNTGGAGYSAAEGVLMIEPIRLTRMACAEPAGNEVEASVIAVLDGSPRYEIESDVLTITNGDGGLVYRAMDAGGPAGG